ncbi:MAG TPA: hypothetical protein HA257_05530 [Candidatus Methanoperedenaceae archaeon]|nr:hypothetical protein [Candidatus Methanoperedenaceae archaeon]
MQKEEKVAAVLLVMALLSLGILYVFSDSGAQPLSPQSVTGDRVYAEGRVLYSEATRTGGHLVLTVESVPPVRVFIRSGAGLDIKRLDIIRVEGRLEDYNAIKEISASSDDVTMLKKNR